MRVAILTNFIAPYRVSLFAALQEIGDDVRIFVSTPMEKGRNWPADWKNLPVVVQRTVTFGRRYRHAGLYSETAQTHVPIDTFPQLRRFRPEVIVSGEFGARTLFAVLYRRLHRDSRLVIWATVSERTELVRSSRKTRTLRRFLLSYADAVLVNGASGRRYIEGYGVSAHRIRKMPYTIDHRHFTGPETRNPAVAHRILVVSQMTTRKGVRPWLALVRRWAEANPERRVEIQLVGEGEELRNIVAETCSPNMALHALGHVPYDRLPEVYRDCGILAFPTLADEWGVVVNEAMVAGLPVLGSIHAQAVEEMVVDGETGWLFDPESPDATLEALDRMMATSPVELDRMRKAAARRVQLFSPQSAAQSLRGVCQATREQF